MRRRAAFRFVAVLVCLGSVSTACGNGPEASSGATVPAGPTSGEGADVAALVSDGARMDPTASPARAGDATSQLGATLFTTVREDAGEENLVLSPASIAIALAMVEPGATGEAVTQLRELLGLEEPAGFHESVNALERSLEGRVPDDRAGEGDPGDLTLRIANAAFLQEDYPFEQAYLDTIGRHYGPILFATDFRPDPDAVAEEINSFVAEATEDRITDLVPPGVIDPDTVLALVNALYLQASWLSPFDESETADDAFTLRDGSEVSVPMMHGFADSSASGDGWVGATKNYVGGLSADFVLPDDGRLDEVAGRLPEVLAELVASKADGSDLVVPRFEVRFAASLVPALKALGLTAPFQEGHLLDIADDPRLIVYEVLHQAYVSMDEQGTEAAAATVVLIEPVSGSVEPPVPVVLDRPFLFRVRDTETGATLFLGQVLDPTA